MARVLQWHAGYCQGGIGLCGNGSVAGSMAVMDRRFRLVGRTPEEVSARAKSKVSQCIRIRGR